MAKFYAKAPDGSDALLSIVLTGFTQSLQQNGWCKLPNGLLFQWQRDVDSIPYPVDESTSAADPIYARFIFTELPLSMSSYLTGIFSVVSFNPENLSKNNEATFTYYGGPHRDTENLIDLNHYIVSITGLHDGHHSKVQSMDINTIFIGIP